MGNSKMTDGWHHLAEDAMATNIDPIAGGIIDKQIVSGKWFVIPNNDAIPQVEDLETKAEALAYLASKVAELSTGTQNQYDVVITYDTTLAAREAVELAFYVVADRGGAYVEIFKDGDDAAAVQGQILNEKDDPKADPVNRHLTMPDLDKSFENCIVVFTYNTIATDPTQALSMALDAIDNLNGGYIEVFAEGQNLSVFEAEIPALFETSPSFQP
jgi:hypothetical protein